MHRNIAGWVTHHWAKWVVVVLSLIFVGGIGGTFGPKLSEIQENDIASFLPGDAESTQVITQSAKLGADPDAVPVVVLYVRDAGITSADTAKVAADAKAIGALASVADEVAGPVPSEDGKALQLIATIQVGDEGFEELPDAVEDIRATAETDADGLEVNLAGPGAFGADQAKAFAGIDGVLLLSALGIVFVLLVLTYRSPILWFIPLLCGVFSVFTAQGFVYLLAKYADLTVNGQSAGILSVLVLGAGVDYALLIVARYREELHNYEDRHQAMSHALHRAAPAVLASGATVIIGLLCLMFAQLNSTSGLGPVAASGIAVALLMMLVLLPALLVVFGRWVFWPFIPRFGTPAHAESGIWSRVGRGIEKAPRAGLDRHDLRAGGGVLRRAPAQRHGPEQRGHLHHHPAVRDGREGARQALSGRRRLPGPGHLRRRQRQGGRGRTSAGRGHRRRPASRCWPRATAWLSSRPPCRPPRTPTTPTRRSTGHATRSAGCRTPKHWSVARRPSTRTCRTPRPPTTD